MDHRSQLIAAAQAEDTYDLLNHIAWTDVIKPRLIQHQQQYTQILVNEALGAKIPNEMTREQVAGVCYGISWVTRLFEGILKEGERALTALRADGITVTS